jgi:hypothetical protein
MESEAGRDIEVLRGDERGFVDRCAGDHVLVKTPQGDKRCWDFHECDELYRTREEFPWR